jgi:hypothetical protein
MIIFEVNIDTQVNELLLSFKGSISCSRRHIHSVMEQIPSLVINFINFSSILHQACNFCLVTSNQCVLESEEPNVVHVVDVSSTNDELFSVIKVLFRVVDQVRSSAFLVSTINRYIHLHEHFHRLAETSMSVDSCI